MDSWGGEGVQGQADQHIKNDYNENSDIKHRIKESMMYKNHWVCFQDSGRTQGCLAERVGWED